MKNPSSAPILFPLEICPIAFLYTLSGEKKQWRLQNSVEARPWSMDFYPLPPFTFEMPILVARGQGRGWKAGSAGGEDPMKGHFPSA